MISSALTLRVRGVVFYAIKQYFVFGLQPLRSFAYIPFHFETYGLQGCIPFCLWLFAFVNALRFVVRPHKLGLHNCTPFSPNKSLAQRYCPYNTLDNTLSLYTSRSPRTPSHHTFVVTNRDIVGRLGTNERLGVATYFRSCVPWGFVCLQLSRLMPLFRYAVKPTLCFGFHCSTSRRHRFARLQYGFAIPTHAESTTIQCAVTYSDMKFAIFELSDMRADGGSSQRVVKGKPLTIPLIYSCLRN